MILANSLFLIFSLIFSSNIYSAEPLSHQFVAVQDGYAQWGRLAMQTAKQKFPDAQIVDYRYDGRTNEGETAIEQFKLWAKKGQEEFGIVIKIRIDQKTNKLKNIQVTKTQQ
ncbi:DUF3889 domain-containing protein [Bacillus mesophilum]|uniref:DUF3889 domain-containing protein n=1 Tax=Bacillus mesophilum TaxID=1071718 RepID=A0A7V7UVW0_9BACI|nr:DUF3889 domain-containing protein [Bacillus mesophilum]KAB2329833.1 DUF3889 domain-containing protein [Bacillus mesophilum]